MIRSEGSQAWITSSCLARAPSEFELSELACLRSQHTVPVDLTMRYKGYPKPNMQIMCSFKDIAARRCYHQVRCNEVVHAVVEHDQRANCNLNRPRADCNLVLTSPHPPQLPLRPSSVAWNTCTTPATITIRLIARSPTQSTVHPLGAR